MIKKIVMVIFISVSVSIISCKDKDAFDPWGVWNEHQLRGDERIRTFSTGKYYEVPFGLYIVKHCDEALPPVGRNFPAMVIPGDYTEIEKYEPTEDGFIFYLVGIGYKRDSGIFQDNTRLQVRMHFVDKDECYFAYVFREDENGFYLSYFPKENIVYKRYRVKKA
jgi:hypothetical protein